MEAGGAPDKKEEAAEEKEVYIQEWTSRSSWGESGVWGAGVAWS